VEAWKTTQPILPENVQLSGANGSLKPGDITKLDAFPVVVSNPPFVTVWPCAGKDSTKRAMAENPIAVA
jgi:hypothetical protein